MTNTVIQEWTDEKGWIHRIEIPLTTFLIEHNLEPVVRCKDCKFWRNDDCKNDIHGYCPISENDFCSRGERREDGETN